MFPFFKVWHSQGKDGKLCGIRWWLENLASLKRVFSNKNSINLSRAKIYSYFGKGLCKV